MKPKIALLLCCVSGFTLSAISCAAPPSRRIAWQTDFRQAARSSAQQGKPMLVMVTAPWCGYCRKMLSDTYVDGRVSALVQEGFLPVLVDQDANGRVAEALGAQALPTTLIISPDLKILSKVSGYQSASELLTRLGRFAPESTAIPAGRGTSPPGSFLSKSLRQSVGTTRAAHSFIDKYSTRTH